MSIIQSLPWETIEFAENEWDDNGVVDRKLNELSDKLCDDRSVHPDYDYANAVIDCIEFLTSTLMVLQNQTITSVSGKAYIGKDDDRRKVWIQVRLNRYPSIVAPDPSPATDRFPSEAFQTWIVYVDPKQVDVPSFEHRIDDVNSDSRGGRVSESKYGSDFAYIVVSLPRGADLMDRIKEIQDWPGTISVEVNVSGHMKQL